MGTSSTGSKRRPSPGRCALSGQDGRGVSSATKVPETPIATTNPTMALSTPCQRMEFSCLLGWHPSACGSVAPRWRRIRRCVIIITGTAAKLRLEPSRRRSAPASLPGVSQFEQEIHYVVNVPFDQVVGDARSGRRRPGNHCRAPGSPTRTHRHHAVRPAAARGTDRDEPRHDLGYGLGARRRDVGHGARGPGLPDRRVTPIGEIEVLERGESGLMGMAFHPDFPTEPWICLVHSFGSNDDIRNRLVRVRYENGQLEPPETLIDEIRGRGNHDGSRLAIGPDRLLYMTMGDAGQRPLSQDTSSLNGKILRLTLDGKPAPEIRSTTRSGPGGTAIHKGSSSTPTPARCTRLSTGREPTTRSTSSSGGETTAGRPSMAVATPPRSGSFAVRTTWWSRWPSGHRPSGCPGPTSTYTTSSPAGRETSSSRRFGAGRCSASPSDTPQQGPGDHPQGLRFPLRRRTHRDDHAVLHQHRAASTPGQPRKVTHMNFRRALFCATLPAPLLFGSYYIV